MQLLAAIDADGTAPLVEGLVGGLARLRRGMTAVIITASLDRGWIRPLTGLRARGVACVVLSVDARAAELVSADRFQVHGALETIPDLAADPDSRALHHALAEHDLKAYRLVAGRSLSEQLAG
jgi:hypothetical protein